MAAQAACFSAALAAHGDQAAGGQWDEEEGEEEDVDAHDPDLVAGMAASMASLADHKQAVTTALAALRGRQGAPQVGGGAPMEEVGGSSPNPALAGGGMAGAPMPGSDGGSSGESSESGHEDNWGRLPGAG